MARHFNEKGQALALSCIIMFFLFTYLIMGVTEVYKLSGQHIKKIEDKNFWEGKND